MELFEWLERIGENVSLFSDRLTLEMVKNLKPNMLISYNYRHMIEPDVLDYMDKRTLNLHISLLPWNRGAMPNLFSFLESTPCGVTIHQIDAGTDTGDILLQEEVHFDRESETLQSSYDKLHTVIQRLFKENWFALKNGHIPPQKQCGISTYHRTSDFAPYRDMVDYSDTITEFLHKAASVKTNDREAVYALHPN